MPSFPYPNRLSGLASAIPDDSLVRNLALPRLGRGGRIAAAGRLPRYVFLFGLGVAAIWGPIAAYLKFAPIRYTSHLSLVLPGQGVSTSVNLSEIGQATSSSNSAYASATLNPAVLYKNMLVSQPVIEAAARLAETPPAAFGKPVIKLVDETSLIGVDVGGRSPEEARRRAESLLTALSDQLDKLRSDEARRRESSSIDTVRDYERAVEDIRTRISALQLQSGLISSEQYNAIVAAGEVLQTRVSESEAALRKKEAEVEALSRTLGVGREIAALTLKAHANPDIGALASAAAKSTADVADLEKLYGPRHPLLVAARSRALGDVAKLQARGEQVTGLPGPRFLREIELTPSGERTVLLSRLVASTAERDGMRTEYEEQSRQLAASRTRVRELVETAAKLDALNRDYKVADAVFASALARINTTKADLYASYPLVQVAEPATLPEKPSSPSKLIAAVAGGGATLFLAIGLALAWIRKALIDKILVRRNPTHD